MNRNVRTSKKATVKIPKINSSQFEIKLRKKNAEISGRLNKLGKGRLG